MKRALVCGAGGFIGGHLVKKLKREGYWVRGVDIKEHEFAPTQADEFLLLDLREPENCQAALSLEDGHPSTSTSLRQAQYKHFDKLSTSDRLRTALNPSRHLQSAAGRV